MSLEAAEQAVTNALTAEPRINGNQVEEGDAAGQSFTSHEANDLAADLGHEEDARGSPQQISDPPEFRPPSSGCGEFPGPSQPNACSPITACGSADVDLDRDSQLWLESAFCHRREFTGER